MRALGPSPATAAPRANLAEQVYAALKQQMHDFALVPGDRFSEAELGQRLGVSRTPVREALFRLRNEGLIEVDGKNGWFVRPIDFARIEQLYDLRVVIETTCVGRLAAMATLPPAIETLKQAWLVPAAERLTDPREVGALDEQFHATLVAAAGNDEMARVHWDVTERIRIVHARRPHRSHLPGARQDPARRDPAPRRPRADAAARPHRAEPERGAQDHAARAVRGAHPHGGHGGVGRRRLIGTAPATMHAGALLRRGAGA
jgi:DNA-binding GntR family transcriptional regulator